VSIGIIGAGISGLQFANRLQKLSRNTKTSIEITLFEKAVKSGGRLSTRKISKEDNPSLKNFHFDHGAQYFTIKDPHFESFVFGDAKEVIQEWTGQVVVLDAVTKKITSTNKELKRYVGIEGMNSIAAHMTQGLNIKTQTRITNISRSSWDKFDNTAKWTLLTDKGESFSDFDIVVITAPVNQTSQLVPKEVYSQTNWKSKFDSIKMEPSWCLMLGFDDPLNAPFDGAFVHNSPISWIAHNTSKPKRPSETECWVVHADSDWSAKNLTSPPNEIQNILSEEFKNLFPSKQLPHPKIEVLHKWSFAKVSNALQDQFLLDTDLGLAICGDWCNGARVEGAFMSGHNLA